MFSPELSIYTGAVRDIDTLIKRIWTRWNAQKYAIYTLRILETWIQQQFSYMLDEYYFFLFMLKKLSLRYIHIASGKDTSRMWNCLKNFTGCDRREMSNSFRFKVLHVAWLEPQRKRWGKGARSPRINSINVEIWPQNVWYITQKNLPAISILCLRVLFQLLIYGMSPKPYDFTCVIRFHIHKLNFDKLSLMKTTSWKFKLCQKFRDAH